MTSSLLLASSSRARSISLALHFGASGPRDARSTPGTPGRIKLLHVTPRIGTNAYHGSLDHRASSQADDLVDMPLQSGTQWDGLGQVFLGEHMWSGYSCREVSSADAQKRGVEMAKAHMVGRGVLLDAPASFGGNCLADGQTGESQGIGVRRDDCVTVRTAGSPTNLLAIK
jgi:hypothetical protein